MASLASGWPNVKVSSSGEFGLTAEQLCSRWIPSARSSRLAGAAGALLLQGGLLLLFLSSMPAFRPPLATGRELILRLPRLIHYTPAPAQSRTAPRTQTQVLPLAPLPLPQTGPALAPAPPATLPGLKAFSQALNGCAPESYASLPPDQKARCPRPGAGVAIQELPNLMGSPSPCERRSAIGRPEWRASSHQPALHAPVAQSPTTPCLLDKAPAPGVSFVCIASMVAGDYALRSQRTWPTYEVQQLAAGGFLQDRTGLRCLAPAAPGINGGRKTHPAR